MIIRKVQDVEELDVGGMFGIPDMGIKIQWLVHNAVGDETYGHRFAFRRFTVRPKVSHPIHHHKYVQCAYILSGTAFFKGSDGEEVEVGPDTIIYTASEEAHGMRAGPDGVTLLCVIECIDGGENCVPEVKHYSLDE
jgi:quercetin dioxygenase-like cupin family protein